MCLKPTVVVSGRTIPHAKKIRKGKVGAGAEAHSDFVISWFQMKDSIVQVVSVALDVIDHFVI